MLYDMDFETCHRHFRPYRRRQRRQRAYPGLWDRPYLRNAYMSKICKFTTDIIHSACPSATNPQPHLAFVPPFESGALADAFPTMGMGRLEKTILRLTTANTSQLTGSADFETESPFELACPADIRLRGV